MKWIISDMISLARWKSGVSCTVFEVISLGQTQWGSKQKIGQAVIWDWHWTRFALPLAPIITTFHPRSRAYSTRFIRHSIRNIFMYFSMASRLITTSSGRWHLYSSMKTSHPKSMAVNSSIRTSKRLIKSPSLVVARIADSRVAVRLWRYSELAGLLRLGPNESIKRLMKSPRPSRRKSLKALRWSRSRSLVKKIWNSCWDAMV